MINAGTNPPDFNAPTGQFRLIANDTVATDSTPPVAGQGEYALFSDNEIAGYMALHPDSLLRAVGTAYLALSGRAAMEAKLIKDYDLQVDLSKRAAALAEAASAYFERADAEDLLSGAHSTFGITAANNEPSFRELMSLPAEQWSFIEDVDLPLLPDGSPLWQWGR